MRESDKNRSLKDQLKQLPRIRKYPPGADRRPNYSAGLRSQDVEGNTTGLQPVQSSSDGPSLRGRTASDQPARVNKRKRDEDSIDDLETAKLNDKRVKSRETPKPQAAVRRVEQTVNEVKSRETPKPQAAVHPRVEQTGNESCRISEKGNPVSKEEVVPWYFEWLLYHVYFCDIKC